MTDGASILTEMTENFTGNQWNSSSLPDSHLIDCHLAKINISQIRQSVLCGNTRECCVVVILSCPSWINTEMINWILSRPALTDSLHSSFILRPESREDNGENMIRTMEAGWPRKPRSQNSDGCRPSVHRPQHSQLNYQKISTDPIIAAQYEFDIQRNEAGIVDCDGWL